MESYVSGEQLSSGSVRSDSTTKKLLKAELEAQRRMAETEEAARQERLATERALVEKTLELKKAEVLEQSHRASSAGPADIDDLLGTAEVERETVNGTYSRYGFIVGEFPSPGLTAGRTDRR